MERQFTRLFSTAIRRATEDTGRKSIPYIYTNPYKAKREWPPDFTKLSPKYQFRFERKYKRRSQLKWARPRWTKGVKVAQMGTILFVTVYGVLFLDWNSEYQSEGEDPPFHSVRTWFFGLADSIFPQSPARETDKTQDDASPVVGPGKF